MKQFKIDWSLVLLVLGVVFMFTFLAVAPKL